MTNTIKLALAASILAGAMGVVPAVAKAGGMALTNSVLVQQKTAAADGTTRVVLAPAKRVVPGDHVVFRIAYRNESGQPISGVVVSNPVQANLSYRGPAEGSPAPEVSVDGVHFGSLGTLTFGGAPVRPEQVRALRWVVHGTVPAGSNGHYSYEAVVK